MPRLKSYHIIIVALILATAVPLGWYQSRLNAASANAESEVFSITAGERTVAIIERLKEEELIASPLSWKIHLYLNKQLKLQAGEYIIEPATPGRELLLQLTRGETASQEFDLLIREGLSVREINEEIKKAGYLLDDSFLAAAAPHEGYLFPDTYRLYKDFTAEDLVAKMRANLDAKLTNDLRVAIAASGKSVGEIIIMASILEKEVRTEEDMKLVAGIFENRLSVGQALQSDATLEYALNSDKAAHTYEETQFDSPYNTYKYPGLPPGPISNPGLRAIRAAVYPSETEYNYFLSRLDTGETIFSRSYEEHLEAKAKYLP